MLQYGPDFSLARWCDDFLLSNDDLVEFIDDFSYFLGLIGEGGVSNAVNNGQRIVLSGRRQQFLDERNRVACESSILECLGRTIFEILRNFVNEDQRRLVVELRSQCWYRQFREVAIIAGVYNVERAIKRALHRKSADSN